MIGVDLEVAHAADPEHPAVLVEAARLAGHVAAFGKLRQMPGRSLAAGPRAKPAMRALLPLLGRVNAFEAHADTTNIDRVAVDDFGRPGHGIRIVGMRRRKGERDGEHASERKRSQLTSCI